MKVSFNIATYQPRLNSLKQVVASLYDQVDIIRICFNELTLKQIPDFFKNCDKVQIIIPKDNLTDNGKFYSLDHLKEDEYYFTGDDDLIYSPEYVQTTLDNIHKYGCIVTYHGRRLKGLGLDYYYQHDTYRCLSGQSKDYLIDVPGTGVTAFNTAYFKPKGLAHAKDKRMSDLVLGLEAAKQGKTIGCCKHEYGFVRHIQHEETIHQTESKKGNRRQNQIADEIFKLKHEK